MSFSKIVKSCRDRRPTKEEREKRREYLRRVGITIIKSWPTDGCGSGVSWD